MRRDLALALALLLAFSQAPAQTPAPAGQQPAAPAAQQPQPQPAQTPAPEEDSDEDDVVRITSNLVQFDAVVTDKHGRHVADLRPDDFEIFVDGRRQEITNFTFVAGEPGAGRAAPPAARGDKSTPAPAAPMRAGQVRRTIALVADDLGTSFEDIYNVRRALKKFVDEQMQPGDLVAVMQTGRGLGALQQFTNNKQLLHRAIERVRSNPQGRAGVSTFARIEPDPLPNLGSMTGGRGGGDRKGAGAEEDDDDARTALDEFREGVFTVGTLGALSYIVRGMREMPGRKSVVVFSGGFQVYRDLNQPKDFRGSDRILDNLRRLTDQANRASVVIYTVDARGLVGVNLTAADNYFPAPGSNPAESPTTARSREILGKQEGLEYLAEQTGGIFIKNTNDLSGGMERILDDQTGFYLIGFRPSEDLFEPLKGKTRFNKFEVKLRRSGLSVRTRAGFYGFVEFKKRPAPRTRNEQLLAALASPLASGELSLRLTSLFNSTAQKTPVVDSLMHIDASQLKLTDEADGWKKAVIDVAAVTFGESGEAVDEFNRTETIRARGEALRLMLSEGLVYMMKVPVKKPGAYQLRVAVRDAQTDKVGSASQFIEVPDLGKGHLALSGVILTSAYDEPAPAAAQPQAAGHDPLREATVRRFRRGSQIDFLYQIYNAKVDPATGRPRLSTQVFLLRDGQTVFTGPRAPFDPGPQKDLTRLKAGNRLQLGLNLAPGDYVLQLVVTDELSKGARATATQWLDFEIVQ
ncbi:MAG TPA: VWA domain-containing protein [Pyrinomonadaceae bacterium]|jgi:VWFA-related protein